MFVQLINHSTTMLHVFQPAQTTRWWNFNTETSPPWYPVKSFLGLIPTPFWIVWPTGTWGLSPHRFSKANPPGLSIQPVPQTCRGHSSSQAAQKTTDTFYQIMTRVDPRRTLVPPKWAPHPPCWDGASWFKICKPCSSESGYEPLSLRGLMHTVCMWINRGSSPTSLTDSSGELLPLKNHQALKSQRTQHWRAATEQTGGLCQLNLYPAWSFDLRKDDL